MSAAARLWRSSPAWRTLVMLALLGSVATALVPPWQRPRVGTVNASASFTPTAKGHAPAAVAGGSASMATLVPPASRPAVDPAPASVTRTLRYSVQDFTSQARFWQKPLEGSLGGGGLVASYCCAGASSTVYADTAPSAGKHYYELQLNFAPGSTAPNSWTDAWVMPVDSGGERTNPRMARPLPGGNTAIGWGRKGSVREGDVFMFALDLDNSQLFYGVNGEWRNGVPDESGGFPLEPGTAYRPYVAIGSGGKGPSDRWTANFGGTRFKYPIPAGYRAFGSRISQPPEVRSVTVTTASAGVVPPFAQIMAGATGGAEPGATSAQAPARPIIGQALTDAVVLAGQRLPLPEGNWTVLAKQSGKQGEEMVVLGNVAGGQLQGLIAVQAYADAQRAGRGFARFDHCDRTENLVRETAANQANGRQECWWISHAVDLWDSDQTLIREAASELRRQGTTPPRVLVDVGFRRADADSFVTAHYYFNPQSEGIASSDSGWRDSEWHRQRIDQHPEKAAYVRKLAQWGSVWAQLIRASA